MLIENLQGARTPVPLPWICHCYDVSVRYVLFYSNLFLYFWLEPYSMFCYEVYYRGCGKWKKSLHLRPLKIKQINVHLRKTSYIVDDSQPLFLVYNVPKWCKWN